jgi:hypothetical protein
VENADVIQEAFKFLRLGPVLLVVSRSFHCVDKMIRFYLLIVALRRTRLVRVARVFFLLLFPGVEGHLLGQRVPIGDGKHYF